MIRKCTNADLVYQNKMKTKKGLDCKSVYTVGEKLCNIKKKKKFYTVTHRVVIDELQQAFVYIFLLLLPI